MRGKDKRDDRRNVTPDQGDTASFSEVRGKRSSRNGVYFFAAAVFLVVLLTVLLVCQSFIDTYVIVFAALFALVAASTVRIAQQWEKAVILRFGRFNRVAGPGIYFVIPIVEHVTLHVDQRIIATPFSAEEALTADLVPLNVDAVLFWLVWDAKSACVEVENYPKAVAWSAQTALRDAIGQVNLAEVATRRRQLDREIQEVLDAKTQDWGITIQSVEIRDIAIPEELQDAMSKEAQAERERNARVILAEVEKDISEMFVEAAEVYEKNDKAMQLRTMNLIYESVKEKGGLVIAPSAFSEGFNNIEDMIKHIGE